jgi:ABC-type glycerol-3-phosphate transport system substrate-binding protein
MKSKSRIKLLAVLCVITLLLAMPAGCNGGHPDSEEGILSTGEQVPDELNGEAFSEIYFPTLHLPVIHDAPIDLTPTNELVIYMPDWISSGLNRVIDRYKLLYPNVNVIVEEIKDDYDEYSIRIATELAAGKGSDIIFPSMMFNSDFYKMANSGAFLDLNKIIEQDEDFNIDGYVKVVLDAGVFRGRRYTMPYMYATPVYISVPEKLDEIGFDVSQTSDTVSFMNEISRTLPKAQANFIRSMFSEYVYLDLILSSGIQIVNFETNAVLPNQRELKKLLGSYKPYHTIDEKIRANPASLDAGDLLNGAIMFARVDRIDRFINLAGQLKTSGDFQISVLPGMDGKISAGSIGTTAIRTGSPNQLNAWNFIKLLLSPEVQGDGHFIVFDPVHIDSIINRFDTFNNLYENSPGATSTIFTKLSEHEKQAYLDIITGVDYCYDFRFRTSPVFKMFEEHINPYIGGERSFEDALARLGSQLVLYMSE